MRSLIVLPLVLSACLGKDDTERVLLYEILPEPFVLDTSYATTHEYAQGTLGILNNDDLDMFVTPLAFDGDGGDHLETNLTPYKVVSPGEVLYLNIEVRDDINLWSSGDFQPTLLLEFTAKDYSAGALEPPTNIGPQDESVPVYYGLSCDWDGDGTDSDACDGGTDCDDTDDGLGPQADELCDGQDNDCDGETDEDDATDAATWYQDLDGDSYGDPDTTAVACAEPEGFVYDDHDCDDLDWTTYPGSFELCDSIDNDCDGEVDEDGAVDATTWYRDADEDGQGTPTDSVAACDQPHGYDDTKGDCDDTRAEVYTGADELCDGLDNDCDDQIDEGLTDCATTTLAAR